MEDNSFEKYSGNSLLNESLFMLASSEKTSTDIGISEHDAYEWQ